MKAIPVRFALVLAVALAASAGTARAELISGSLKPLSMVQGITDEARCALFIGYHAGAGSQAGILDHTYYGRVVARLRVNGKDWNETAVNAAVCGALGVPVALVTGDQTVCAQARDHLETDARVEGQLPGR